ncbi:P44/Msp2 family outer membrane protein [Candidatus Neoehrlichia procyonis]|uniref:Outer membrane beta-barrel domain protein n=1 Tax=Candidatus Neoehrlichia procyonis str. RAC413 TaxID=1359163 RepID=A0A0F3NMX8_9RICK|nr:P44/Msp2 family outer membrane protein [Candidatus Neoehrlichia lotoris]KJV69415.1 outer membrane beta-barrel domain protein [Candidatus Neoehrlichia lotoris str. RAC413]
MSYKNFYIRSTLAIIVMLLPNISFATTSDVDKLHGIGNFYVSAFYNPTLSQIRDFTIAEPGSLTKVVLGYKKDANTIALSTHSNFNVKNFEYHFNNNILFALSGAAGYAVGDGLRIEFEVGYEQFNTKGGGDYIHEDAHKFCALSRENNISDQRYVTVKIDAITTVSLMMNACYDLISSNTSITPYLCAGIGSNIVNVTQSYLTPKLAYKIKAGLNYPLIPEASISVGVFYHSILDTEYKSLPVYHPSSLSTAPMYTNATAKFGFSYFGGEIGVRFMF